MSCSLKAVVSLVCGRCQPPICLPCHKGKPDWQRYPTPQLWLPSLPDPLMIFGTGVHWNLAFTLKSSLSSAVACTNPSMKSAFNPAKNRKEHTSAADCGGTRRFKLTYYFSSIVAQILKLFTICKSPLQIEYGKTQTRIFTASGPQTEQKIKLAKNQIHFDF